MLVIEGKVGKFRKIEEIIKLKTKHSKKVLMIDSVGLRMFDIDNLDIYVFDNNDLGELKHDLQLKDMVSNSKYDIVIFEVNDSVDKINEYKEAETFLNVECVVTIQNNDLNDIKTYRV